MKKYDLENYRHVSKIKTAYGGFKHLSISWNYMLNKLLLKFHLNAIRMRFSNSAFFINFSWLALHMNIVSPHEIFLKNLPWFHDNIHKFLFTFHIPYHRKCSLAGYGIQKVRKASTFFLSWTLSGIWYGTPKVIGKIYSATKL